MFGRNFEVGSGVLALEPSQLIKLTVFIQTNYFTYWFTLSTNFFQLPVVHEKLQYQAENAQGIIQLPTNLLTIEHQERSKFNLISCVIMLLCNYYTIFRKSTIYLNQHYYYQYQYMQVEYQDFTSFNEVSYISSYLLKIMFCTNQFHVLHVF